MLRFFASLFVGLIIGIAVGLFLGWEVIPVEFVDSPMTSLATNYKEEYTVMIAAGYLKDGDPLGAVQRLSHIGVANVPEYVQNVTEKYISNSRDLNDIRLLVTLSEGLGRLTPIMEPYRMITVPGTGQ